MSGGDCLDPRSSSEPRGDAYYTSEGTCFSFTFLLFVFCARGIEAQKAPHCVYAVKNIDTLSYKSLSRSILSPLMRFVVERLILVGIERVPPELQQIRSRKSMPISAICPLLHRNGRGVTRDVALPEDQREIQSGRHRRGDHHIYLIDTR